MAREWVLNIIIKCCLVILPVTKNTLNSFTNLFQKRIVDETLKAYLKTSIKTLVPNNHRYVPMNIVRNNPLPVYKPKQSDLLKQGADV